MAGIHCGWEKAKQITQQPILAAQYPQHPVPQTFVHCTLVSHLCHLL